MSQNKFGAFVLIYSKVKAAAITILINARSYDSKI